MLFHLATVAPIDDKRVALPDDLRGAMEWPSSIRTMFDYRNRIPGVYNRLYQLCIISLCADIEFFFKGLFEHSRLQPPKGRGFFQRFDDVVTALEQNGFSFSSIGKEIAMLRQAFRLRHTCIHNFGIVDDDFASKSARPVTVGEIYIIDQEEYLSASNAYRALLINIDRQLVAAQPINPPDATR